jgi:two-component system, NarL family, nitrate/nitrite response regulator NarL
MMEESSATIDIVIADDHAILREGVRKLLESESEMRVVGEAADCEETVRVVSIIKPQILLLDLSMSKKSGIEALRDISRLGLPTRTIILTATIDQEQVVEVLQLGARGIVMKHSATNALLESIRCVASGKHWVDQESVPHLIQAVRGMEPPVRASADKQDLGLTPREMQIIALIVVGYTNKDIARELKISQNTSKHHLTNIFNKLGVSNRLELVLYAIDNRLVESE